MTTLARIITPDDVLSDVQAGSRKHCLEILSGLLTRGEESVGQEDVFSSLIERERLGCTGVGDGIAFPHCRVSGIGRSRGAFMRLAEAIEYEAPDGIPVDLVFGLLVPAEADERQRAEIAEIAQLLGHEGLRARLRSARNSRELYDALTGSPGSTRYRSAESR